MSGLEADPHRDQVLRDAGETVANIIIELVADPESRSSLMGNIARSEMALTTISLNTKKLQRPGLDLPDDIQFDLVFLPQFSSAVAAFGASPLDGPPLPKVRASEAFMYLNVLPPGSTVLASVRPRDLHAGIVRTLQTYPDIMVHEATHMLDHFRGGEFFLHTAPPYDAGQTGRDPEAFAIQYINNAFEFNAHFQQGMFELRKQLVKYSTAIQRRAALANFDNFLAMARRTRSLDTLMHTTRGKWRRKLDARLYQTWMFWKEGVGEHSEGKL